MVKTLNGLIAILRGVQPSEVIAVANVLIEAGFTTIEVPLNSPEPLKSIELLSQHFGEAILIGAGTVCSARDVDVVKQTGARLVLSPNCDAQVIARTRELGLLSMPGVATPSEAFAALAAGAHALKLFPADVLGVASFKAWRSVLPQDSQMFAVGGVDLNNLLSFKQAGAAGAGLGSALYKPGMSLHELAANAQAFCTKWKG